mgnify:CR=1 FL=1
MPLQTRQTPPEISMRLLSQLFLMHLVLMIILIVEYGTRFILLAILSYLILFMIALVSTGRISNSDSISIYDVANRGIRLGFQFALPLAIIGISLKIVYGIIVFPVIAFLAGVALLVALLLLIYGCPYTTSCVCLLIYKQNRTI